MRIAPTPARSQAEEPTGAPTGEPAGAPPTAQPLPPPPGGDEDDDGVVGSETARGPGEAPGRPTRGGAIGVQPLTDWESSAVGVLPKAPMLTRAPLGDGSSA